MDATEALLQNRQNTIQLRSEGSWMVFCWFCKCAFVAPMSNMSNMTPNSIQSLVILGSLLQSRWQWASLGHFVFLFLTCPTSTKGKTSGWFGAFCVCLITYLHDWAICPKISQTCRNHMFQIVPEKIWPYFRFFGSVSGVITVINVCDCCDCCYFCN